MCRYCFCSVKKSITGDLTPTRCFERALVLNGHILFRVPSQPRQQDMRTSNTGMKYPWKGLCLRVDRVVCVWVCFFSPNGSSDGWPFMSRGINYSFQNGIRVHLKAQKAGGSFVGGVTHCLMFQSWKRSFPLCVYNRRAKVTPRSTTGCLKDW